MPWLLKGASWNFIARFFIPWNFRFFIPWNFKHVSSKTHENISKWQSSQRGETKHNRAFLKKDDQGTGSLWWNASIPMRMTMIIAVIIMVMVMNMTKKMQDEWLQLLYDYETYKSFWWPIKGTVSRDICFFHESSSPKPLKITQGKFRIFRNLRRYSQVKVHHRYQWRRWQIATGINDTGGKQWEQFQTADNLKWTWRKKYIYMLTLLPKGVQKKQWKLSWFFAPWAANISANFRKNSKRP